MVPEDRSLFYYSAQSSPPFTHSYTNPIKRMKRNKVARVIDKRGLLRMRLKGSGNMRAISRSNKRNNMATRKKRNENGIRAEFSGSKPHS